jgi:hypothetical protein
MFLPLHSELTKCDEILSLTVTYDSLVKFGGIWDGISTPFFKLLYSNTSGGFCTTPFLDFQNEGSRPSLSSYQWSPKCYMYICHIVYTWQEAMIVEND